MQDRIKNHNTMPENTPQTPPEQQSKNTVEIDPFFDTLGEDLKKVVGEVNDDIPPADLDEDNDMTLPPKLGEMVVRNSMINPDDEPGEESKNDDDKPDDTKKPDSPAPNADNDQTPPKKVTVKKIEGVAPPPGSITTPHIPPAPVNNLPKPSATPKQDAVPTTQPQPEPAPQDPDAEYIKTLTDEQRDQYELAKFAETKFPELKGKAAETINFFKKVEAFARENPTISPDSEEFRDFVLENRPKWPDGKLRQIERQWIQEQAAAEAERKLKEKIQRDLEEVRRKQYEIEVRPKIEKAATQFRTRLASEIKMPQDIDPLAQEVAAKINEAGFEAAIEEYPVEAPIVKFAYDAAEEYLRISNGLSQVDLSNPVHNWLANFISNQGRLLANAPEQHRKDANGRIFLPRDQYAELIRTNPEAANSYWTFSDQQILDMIATNSILHVHSELKRLEKAGFKRERKKEISDKKETPAPQPQQKTEPEKTSATSPRSTTTKLPGAVTQAPKSKPVDPLIDALVPGASSIIS